MNLLVKKTVECMNIFNLGPENKVVWDKFYDSAETVLDCLLEGK